MDSEIRILLVDDHSLFRESLSRLLQTETAFQIVSACASATEALALPRLQGIDVVLLDYDLGREQGAQFLDSARAHGFSGRILIVTAGMSDGTMLSALEKGCCGVFLKHSPPSQLVEAIKRVKAGEVWLDPAVTRFIVATAADSTGATTRSQASAQREQSVLSGVFEGLTNREIAARLAISESSVKVVLQRLFEKTGARTRSQLVRIALEGYSDQSSTLNASESGLTGLLKVAGGVRVEGLEPVRVTRKERMH